MFVQDKLTSKLTIIYAWLIVKKYNYICVKPLWITKKTEYLTSTILTTTTFKIGLEVSCLLCFASLNFYSLKQLYFFIVSWTFKSRGFLKQDMSFALFSSLCWINWLRTYKEVLLSILQFSDVCNKTCILFRNVCFLKPITTDKLHVGKFK